MRNDKDKVLRLLLALDKLKTEAHQKDPLNTREQELINQHRERLIAELMQADEEGKKERERRKQVEQEEKHKRQAQMQREESLGRGSWS